MFFASRIERFSMRGECVCNRSQQKNPNDGDATSKKIAPAAPKVVPFAYDYKNTPPYWKSGINKGGYSYNRGYS